MVVDPGASSINVTVRVRPFTIREAAQLTRTDEGTLFLGDGSLAAAPTPKLNTRGIRPVIKVVDDRCLVFDPPEDNPVQRFSRSVVPNGKKVKDQVFAFDRIFDDNATQNDVYEATTRTLLDSVLDGYNATVFAYGATGCGKTHTITGTSQHPGIIFLTMQELFEKIADRSQEKTTEVTLSYLEIYNETIRDLLVPGGSKQGLMLREDSNQAVSVAGLTSHRPKDVQEVMDMIVRGNEFRTVSPTEANATSSRSHAVLQINVAQKDRNADVNEPHTMATLSIIDLAGSERASATKNRGERLLEGANINKSLLALGSCINALCDPRKKNHVPYRNSKLTRLLKFSLGGNCKTVMIVCVSPSSVHFDETQNTLRYANRAKNIQTKVTRNVFNVNRHVKDFLVKIDEQMALINELKAQQKDAEQASFAKFRKQQDRRDAIAREGIQRIRVAYDNSAGERQEKLNNMKKLRSFERRIGLLSSWLASFDAICDARGDEDMMPSNLVSIRKTASGILSELEHSRHHMIQKLDKFNWERALDTALHHSIQQLPGDDAADCGEVANLSREVEVLKASFGRESYRDVLDFDKTADASMVQVLLTAQFDMLASLSETLAMKEEDAVSHAKSIINRLLEVGYTAASHVVKPDGSCIPVEKFSPSKRGTPKRKKAAAVGNIQPIAAPLLPVADALVLTQPIAASPMKTSPRRRKPINARKGVSFTPVKKKAASQRSVRWRDDESEDGTLADFDKTPKKYESTQEQNSPDKALPLPPMPAMSSLPAMPTLPVYLETTEEEPEPASDSSPSLELPETSTLVPAKPNRFQAGFLSKGSARVSSIGSGSPSLPTPTFSVKLAPSPSSSDNGDKLGPLSPPRCSFLGDENNPPSIASGHSSDSDSSKIDHQKLRNALHSAKKAGGRRVSSMSGSTTTSARRISSIGPLPERAGHRASLSYSGPLASSTNARRMNFGSSVKLSGVEGSSPGARAQSLEAGKTRRITIGGLGAMGGAATRERDVSAGRASVGWR
ncbi:Kinesin-like protein 5 like [Verticillium longisporum]|uniref:Kinesin-like protein 5 like n=1 Tax=Verticillium longisporum TaxID=100787 RepID=A0A8I2ZYY8_VERLO|nr:Kinesin-like protein 5 like [Verticillium longisporum]